MPGTARAWWLASCLLALSLDAACRKPTPSVAPLENGRRAPASAAQTDVPTRGVGMDDPFGRLDGALVRTLDTARKAFRGKRYPEASTSFAAVVEALPDNGAARFQQLKALALAGQFAELPELWRQLLARDFVAFAGRLDRPAELAPLRASEAWPALRRIEATLRPAYAAGLAGGVFFVARTHARDMPRLDTAGVAPLRLSQEVFHYDRLTGRYRRLTDTGGRVFALALSPDGKTLSVLIVSAVARLPDGALAFRDPQAARLNLTTLASSVAAPLGPTGLSARRVTLCHAKNGEPLWQTEPATPGERPPVRAFDASGMALVLTADQACAPGPQTEATPEAVRALRPEDPRVRLSEAGDLVSIAGVERPLRVTRPVNPVTIVWSPGGTRIAYAGLLDPCKVAREGSASPATHNELHVWDFEKQRSQRIASAVSRFFSVWLDDEHLIYEGGVGGAARLYVYDAVQGRSTQLKTGAGAGLFGHPMLDCDDEHQDDEPGDAMPPPEPDDVDGE